jgi:hypothetical protein
MGYLHAAVFLSLPLVGVTLDLSLFKVRRVRLRIQRRYVHEAVWLSLPLVRVTLSLSLSKVSRVRKR